MTTLALEVLAGVSLLWLFHVYLGYPAVLFLVSLRRGSKSRLEHEPTVTVVTAAFDEEPVIAAGIENKLAQDYPADKMDIIVISDGSTDRTAEITEGLVAKHPGQLRLILQNPRQGKTAAINLAAPIASGEILVFADANSMYDRAAIRHLVSVFADPSVGYATGRMIYTNSDGTVTGDGCTTYMRYENGLRELETRVGSVVGVDGAIDAVRRSLYHPMLADQLPDFVLPLHIVEQGFRVVYVPDAILREPALESVENEYRMRVRVALRAMWTLFEYRRMLNPFRFPLFAWQLASHKTLRYLAFIPQFFLFVSNLMLAGEGRGFAVLFAAQLGFYLLAALGYLLSRVGVFFPITTAAYYLVLLNASCADAFWRFLRGEKKALWTPRVG